MSDYIKREDAIKEIKEWATNLLDPRYIVREDAECALMDLPSADVVEVRHGHWAIIYKSSSSLEIPVLVECSECGHERYIQPGEKVNYCPNCGARMDGESE